MPGQVCTRAIADDLRELSIAAMRDFGARFRLVDATFTGKYNDEPGNEAPE
jgi:hypothetical protein